MKFEDYNISPDIKKSLAELGFNKPTDIQFKAIPPILNGEDVLAIAQTGTGKTAAFAIPVLNLIVSNRLNRFEGGVKCLVIVPTHELAIQTDEVFRKLGKYTKVRTCCIHGGVNQNHQIDELANGVEVVVATPGRVFDLVNQRALILNTVEVLVIDEADHMLDLGFIKDIYDIVRRLPRTRQTLFFSATINEKIKDLAYDLVKNAIRIQISPKDPVSKNINHSVAFIEMDDKRFFLERVINENPDRKFLVFVRTKVRAERVAKAMERVQIETLTIHSGKEQQDREETMESFRSGKVKILIATDISSRGVDIEGVDYVVNYDLPDVPENYVHRVGRTGRGKNKGVAVSFCSDEERPMLNEIEKLLLYPIAQLEIDKNAYQETIALSIEPETDWKRLIRDAEIAEAEYLKKKKKKKKK